MTASLAFLILFSTSAVFSTENKNDEETLQHVEQGLEKRLQELHQREVDLEKREQKSQKVNKELNLRKLELDKRSLNLQKLEYNLEQREQNARVSEKMLQAQIELAQKQVQENFQKMEESLYEWEQNLIAREKNIQQNGIHFVECERSKEKRVVKSTERSKTAGKMNEYGWTGLHIDAFHGRTSNLKRQLQAGANINAQTLNGATPLIWASRCGRIGMVKLLLEFNADSKITDNRGNTALHLAKPSFNKQSCADIIRAHELKISTSSKFNISARSTSSKLKNLF